jgi:uncharacterized protein (TIGR03085 family)
VSSFPASTPSTPSLATSERAALCDLFEQVGPSAPTLCTGWDTHHLVAHLCQRESNPLALLRTALTPSSASGLDALVDSSAFSELVASLRRGPASLSVFALPQVDRFTGALEFFVHHEDVRRAEPGWTVRDLPGHSQDEIWSVLRWAAKVVMRRSPVGAELVRSGTQDSVTAAKGPDKVLVRGLPSELALFAFGRTEAARVDLDASAHAVDAIRRARLGP